MSTMLRSLVSICSSVVNKRTRVTFRLARDQSRVGSIESPARPFQIRTQAQHHGALLFVDDSKAATNPNKHRKHASQGDKGVRLEGSEVLLPPPPPPPNKRPSWLVARRSSSSKSGGRHFAPGICTPRVVIVLPGSFQAMVKTPKQLKG